MWKRDALWGVVVACSLLLSSSLSAAITNGGFENGTAGWTADYAHDGTNWGNSYVLNATTSARRSGGKALFGGVGLASDEDGSDTDWARLYAWSEYQDLRATASIRLHISDIGFNAENGLTGMGEQIYLALNDGSDEARVCLADRHEEPFDSLIDLGEYTTSTGADGHTWYGFDVALNTASFGAGISALDLSNTKIGIQWESIVWHDHHEKLWSQCAVDDISLVPSVPEPAGLLSLGLTAGALLLRRPRR